MTEAKPITIPPVEIEKLAKKKDCPLEGSIKQDCMKKCDYRGLVVCLNYLGLSSRPDICLAANPLSSFEKKTQVKNIGTQEKLSTISARNKKIYL